MTAAWTRRATCLEREGLGLHRYRALESCLSMIFSESRFTLFRIMLYASSTASAPFTASAESVTVFSSEGACTEMFSAKKRASVT